ncbi:MAG: GNAT family N-acetyltransferase [Desulfobacterales bacterium]|nr:GNAT family N-acetyltransferase [Desulfobacterales bacterium]
MNIHYYKSHLKRHGVLKTVFRLFSQSVNKLFTLKIRYLIKFDLKALNSEDLAVDDRFQITRLEPDWLSRHVDLEEYQMSKSFLNRAQRKGDICFGILNNGMVAAFSWYSNKPSLLLEGELELKFSNNCLYVHNVYTHPDYRGRRLLAIGISNALRELSTLGFNSFISVVAFDNFSSLKSMYRMGWKKVGQFIYIRFFKTQTGFSIGKKKHSGFEVRVIKRRPLKK